LAEVLARLAQDRGATFRYDAHVSEIMAQDGRITGVKLANGEKIATRTVLFNGDPRALAIGDLGADCTSVAPQTKTLPRSLSAQVWAFAAKPAGPVLAHHNVFFTSDPKPEFDALERGQTFEEPTLYICAMDRGLPDPPPEIERFEIIANAPPTSMAQARPEEFATCQMRTFQTLAAFGLHFDPLPGEAALSTPQQFAQLFPQTAGSLYGQSPHGTMAAFQRPTARTQIEGLYLAGGGVHPGAGVPMATLSAKHAAEAILKDRTSTSMSRQTAMRGGMSMGSATTAAAPSVSSGS
jgi:1-hydroxycarotenoid 3,4-desaturase